MGIIKKLILYFKERTRKQNRLIITYYQLFIKKSKHRLSLTPREESQLEKISQELKMTSEQIITKATLLLKN